MPANAEPVMPADHGEPADPLEGATKAERRAWSKKHQAKAVRVWSSTNVRYLLGQGRIKDADAILGHMHAVEGTVVHGEERGRTIGFPTANLSQDVFGYLPVDGVYAGWLVDLGKAGDEPGKPVCMSAWSKPTPSPTTGLICMVIRCVWNSPDSCVRRSGLHRRTIWPLSSGATLRRRSASRRDER